MFGMEKKCFWNQLIKQILDRFENMHCAAFDSLQGTFGMSLPPLKRHAFFQKNVSLKMSDISLGDG